MVKYNCGSLAVVVAQLAVRPPPKPEVRGSNPVTGKFYTEHVFQLRDTPLNLDAATNVFV